MPLRSENGRDKGIGHNRDGYGDARHYRQDDQEASPHEVLSLCLFTAAVPPVAPVPITLSLAKKVFYFQ
jgi:hypothetical protein